MCALTKLIEKRQRCKEHDDQLHGGEADELRRAVESLIEKQRVVGVVPIHALQRVLDQVDARDAPAFTEAKKTS